MFKNRYTCPILVVLKVYFMSQCSYQQARQNMVESHIKTWGVTDKKLLDIFAKLPREQFVDKRVITTAYADAAAEIGYGRKSLPPKVLARAIQAVEIKPSDKVLQIGAGTGYGTCAIAMLAKHVTAVEIQPNLADIAVKNIDSLNIKNATIQVGNAANGWSSGAPFDVIIATGAYYKLPESLKASLSPNGRIFAVVGKAPCMGGYLIQAKGKDYVSKCLFETEIPYLDKISLPEQFVF